MLQALGSPWSSSCSSSHTPGAHLCLQARFQQPALASSTLRSQCCHAKAHKRPWQQTVAAASLHSWHSSTNVICCLKRRRLTTTCAQTTADSAEHQQDAQQAATLRRMPVTVISGFLGTSQTAHTRHTSPQAARRAATCSGASSCTV
jgi:hypothetical protein